MEYWRSQLAGELPRVQLPSDRPRPSEESHQGAVERFELPTTLAQALKRLAEKSGGSLYVTYAKVGTGGLPEDGVGNGFVRRFNTNGVRDLTFGINGSSTVPLNAPWGIVIAPASFGIFGSALLVGNFGEGGPSISAFIVSRSMISVTVITGLGMAGLWGPKSSIHAHSRPAPRGSEYPRNQLELLGCTWRPRLR